MKSAPGEIGTNNPHDKFVKRALSLKDVQIDFFKKHLPAEVIAVLDWDSIKPYSTSFVNEQNKSLMDDLVFKASFSGCEGYIAILIEHQSQADLLMPIRILEYTLAVIRHHLDNFDEKRIPLVLPFVIYQSDKPYHHSTDIKELVHAPRFLVDEYFLQPFRLIDLGSPEVQRQIVEQPSFFNALAQILFEVAKRKGPEFKLSLEIAQQIDPTGTHRLTECVLLYVSSLATAPRDKTALIEAIESLPAQFGGNVMNLVEEFREEGRHEGLLEGQTKTKREMAVEMLNENLSLELISKITKLSVSEIKAISLGDKQQEH